MLVKSYLNLKKRLKLNEQKHHRMYVNDRSSFDFRSSSLKLFSLNINNYPSYAIALKQLRELIDCEPISIKTALTKVSTTNDMIEDERFI